MKKLLRTAAAMLMLCIVALGAGCSSGIKQPEWLEQAICEHDFDEKVIIKEPTCTELGSAQKFCSKCGMEKTIIQKALGHTEIVDEEIAATCTQPGLTAGSHCSVCGVVTIKQEEIARKHTDEDLSGICEGCGESIFDDASYVTVSSGEILSGWYRVSFREGETDGIFLISNAEFIGGDEITFHEGSLLDNMIYKENASDVFLIVLGYISSVYTRVKNYEKTKYVFYNDMLYIYADPNGYECTLVVEKYNMETGCSEEVREDVVIVKNFKFHNFTAGKLEKVIFN